MQITSDKPRRKAVWLLLLLVCLAQPAWGAGNQVEVRRLGLSKVGDNTLLTVVLDRPASPLVSSREVGDQSQLVVDFPQAHAGLLPSQLEGDESLVQQVVTKTISAQGGVRIVLDLFPGKPYVYWQKSRAGSAGQTFFILGLKPDLRAEALQAREAPPVEPAPATMPPPPTIRNENLENETVPETPEPGSTNYLNPAQPGNATAGSFAELRSLMPQAGNLFQGLENTGWQVSESHRYDRPGTRLSRDFTLTNYRYPELAVQVAFLPANVPGTPNIMIIVLTTEKIATPTATEYKGLRQWTFAKIKKKYEDIGDFFDDALKPLRVKLRQETQALALRDAAVFQNFLKLTCPNDPQVLDRVMKLIKKKVSPRFEGVQYTVNQKPLVFLNLVDFLYLRVYYINQPH